MKKRQNTLVPRNPYALAACQRKAGAHDKKHKIKRRDARQQLRHALQQQNNGGDFPPFLLVPISWIHTSKYV